MGEPVHKAFPGDLMHCEYSFRQYSVAPCTGQEIVLGDMY